MYEFKVREEFSLLRCSTPKTSLNPRSIDILFVFTTGQTGNIFHIGSVDMGRRSDGTRFPLSNQKSEMCM